MPIVRSYFCNDCAHTFSVTLSYDQVDAGPPDCPHCSGATSQDFKPVAIAGIAAVERSDARKIAETIAVEDYGVADMNIKNYEGDTPKVRYKDPARNTDAGSGRWVGPNGDMLRAGIVEGQAVRAQFGGSGLDVLQRNLANGSQPDLIDASIRRMKRAGL